MNKDDSLPISWVGSDSPYLDSPIVDRYKHITIGRYGGNTSANANKNEDGLLCWCDPDKLWEFGVLLDAHTSNESAELIIKTLQDDKESLHSMLESSVEFLFEEIEKLLIRNFKSEEFLMACRSVTGETSCLICVRKENYLWWFSVGDCMLFLLHSDLINFGQTLLNQRNFYEWIGRVNTFELKVPCYSSGRRELRAGRNSIVMVTDGFLQNNREMSSIIKIGEDSIESVGLFLNTLHYEQTSDSTTLITWSVDNINSASEPSDCNSGRIDIR